MEKRHGENRRKKERNKGTAGEGRKKTLVYQALKEKEEREKSEPDKVTREREGRRQ